MESMKEGGNTNLSDRVNLLDADLNDKISKLALNGDEVSNIQRHVLGTLDKRIEELEVFKNDDHAKLQEHILRMFTLEIKLEKLVPLAQNAIDGLQS